MLSAPHYTYVSLQNQGVHKSKEATSSDCLPATAHVWVEGKTVPQSVCTLRAGERVLCYDSLTGGLKYAAISNVSSVEREALTKWVTLVLEDGVTLEVTAEHPVFAWSDEAGPEVSSGLHKEPGRCLRAVDLQAGRDRLMVLKTVAVPVHSVESGVARATGDGCAECHTHEGSRHVPCSACGEVPACQVELTVQQPERHSIFVARGPGGPACAMAVGSSDLVVGEVLHHRLCRVTHTFLASAASSSLAGSQRRTRSAPSVCVNPTMVPAATSAAVGAEDRTPGSSLTSDTSLRASGPRVSSPSGLSQKAGLPSVGSAQCSQGTCTPCAFHARWLRQPQAKPCRNGALCAYCHGDHQGIWRSAFRKLRPLGKITQQARGLGDPG